MKPILKMSALTKVYNGSKILDSLEFELNPGQVTGLLGRNGSGKTTLMKLAVGLILADHGDIELMGECSTDISSDVKQRLGFVPQEAIGFESFTIEQLFKFVGKSYKNWDDAYATELCRLFELPWPKKVGRLSGGQKQLVAIILALAHRPDCLILDEPVSALDPVNRREFLSQIIDLAVDHRSTVLFSTHITSDIERIASHVNFLSRGKIELSGELEMLKDLIYRAPLDLDYPDDVECLFEKRGYQILKGEKAALLPGAQRMNLDDLFVAINSNGD